MPRKKATATIDPPAQTITVEAKPSLNKTDAKKLVARINNHLITAGDHLNSARLLLLELYQGEGWKALGYKSWRSCVDTEFEKSQTHLYRQLKAAQIEAEISPIGEIGQIPESQLRPLAKLPEGARAEAWEEVQEATNGKVTAKAVEEVVSKRLNGNGKTVSIEPPGFREGDLVTGKCMDTGSPLRGKISQFLQRDGQPSATLVDLKQGLRVGDVAIESLCLVEQAPEQSEEPDGIILAGMASSCLGCAHLQLDATEIDGDEGYCGFFQEYIDILDGCPHYAQQLELPAAHHEFVRGDLVRGKTLTRETLEGEIVSLGIVWHKIRDPNTGQPLENVYDLELLTAASDRPLRIGVWVEAGDGDRGQVIQIEGVTALVEILEEEVISGQEGHSSRRWFDVGSLKVYWSGEDSPAANATDIQVGDWVEGINSDLRGQVTSIDRAGGVPGVKHWVTVRVETEFGPNHTTCSDALLRVVEPPTQQRTCQNCKHYQPDFYECGDFYENYCAYFGRELDEGEDLAESCEEYELYQEQFDSSQEYCTPDHIQEAVIKVLEVITLDPCSNSKESPNIAARKHYVRRDNGLIREWRGSVYMNPPYTPNGTIVHWIQKLIDEYEEGGVSEAIALVPAYTDTKWFKLFKPYPICFLEGRLTFKGSSDPARFPSAVVYLGDRLDRFAEVFGGLGVIRVTITSGEAES